MVEAYLEQKIWEDKEMGSYPNKVVNFFSTQITKNSSLKRHYRDLHLHQSFDLNFIQSLYSMDSRYLHKKKTLALFVKNS